MVGVGKEIRIMDIDHDTLSGFGGAFGAVLILLSIFIPQLWERRQQKKNAIPNGNGICVE